MLGAIVNFNTGEGRVRALVVREGVDPDDDTRVFLHGPDEPGSRTVRLITGEADASKPFGYKGIPRRSPDDYGDEGGGLTWHEVEEERNDEEPSS
jgi:hypothetical protein